MCARLSTHAPSGALSVQIRRITRLWDIQSSWAKSLHTKGLRDHAHLSGGIIWFRTSHPPSTHHGAAVDHPRGSDLSSAAPTCGGFSPLIVVVLKAVVNRRPSVVLRGSGAVRSRIWFGHCDAGRSWGRAPAWKKANACPAELAVAIRCPDLQ